jgi:hypothetical protein
MRTRGQIAQKMKQVQFRALKRELGRLLKRSAPNCSNNRVLDLDIGPVGLCSLDCKVCDVRFDDRAPECDDWEVRHEKEAIKESLKEFFRTRTVSEIAVRFPDVAALMWTLTEEGDYQAGPLLTDAVKATSVELFQVQLWADTEEEREEFERGLKPIVRRLEASKKAADLLEVDPEAVAEAIEDIKAELHDVRESWNEQLAESDALRREVTRLSAELEVSEERVDDLKRERAEIQAIPWWRRLWPF